MNRFGIDVSNHQGSIDWSKVANRAAFVFVKTSEGMTFEDPFYTEDRVKALRREGIPFGPYHFATNEGASGKEEARRFVRIAKSKGWGKKGDLPGVLDIEVGHGGRPGVRFVREFVREYKRLTGHRPIVYTGSFWRDALRNPMTLMRCKLWLAAYVSDWRPFLPRAWKKPWLWQYTDSAHCPGVDGPVDGNRFLKSERHFRRMKLRGDIP